MGGTTPGQSTPETPLVGRTQELRQLTAALDAAGRSSGSSICLVGEAGIGKTAVARDIEREARSRGYGIVFVTAIESEMDMAFSSLSDLTRPILGHLDTVTPYQAAALSAALGLGPPAAADPFAISTAVLSLLSTAAQNTPLLVIVDDVQWVDAASLPVFQFVGRRLADEPVLLLFTTRQIEATPEAAEVVMVSGLARTEATALLASVASGLTPDTSQWVLDTAHGNPLGIIELARASASRGDGAPGVATQGATTADSALVRRLQQLSRPTRVALLIAALSRSSEFDVVSAAAIRLEPTANLDSAIESGIVRVDITSKTFSFAHPRFRALSLRESDAARRAANLALADEFDQRSDISRCLWHRADAATEPDDELAAALDTLAAETLARQGPGVAASTFQRAASLSVSVEDQARRLFAAGRSWLLAGNAAGAETALDSAWRRSVDPLVRADVTLWQCRLRVGIGPVPAIVDTLAAEADRMRDLDHVRHATLLSNTISLALMAGQWDRALSLASEFEVAGRRLGGEPETLAAAVHGTLRVLLGAADSDGDAPDRLAAALLGMDPMARAQNELLAGWAYLLALTDRPEPAQQLIGGLIELARTFQIAAMLPYPLATMGDIEIRIGRWTLARAAFEEGLSLAPEVGQRSDFLLAMLAQLAAIEGRFDECYELADRAERLMIEHGGASGIPVAMWARGLAAVGGNDLERARREFERLVDFDECSGNRHVLYFGQPASLELLEILVRMGDREGAASILADDRLLRRVAPLPLGRAALSRSRGILAEPGEIDRHFVEAMGHHDNVVNPFHRARTLLAWGESLRRARRSADARVPLASAVDVFRRLGAVPWTERSERELVAAGGQGGGGFTAPTLATLSSKEMMVAAAVAQGMTNREVSASLFMSPKTVESHLSRVFAKLGVRGRTELTRLVLQAQAEHA